MGCPEDGIKSALSTILSSAKPTGRPDKTREVLVKRRGRREAILFILNTKWKLHCLGVLDTDFGAF